jgi:hypothetical protein
MPLLVLFLITASNLLPSRLFAQSGCGGTLASFAYDTTVVSTDPQNQPSFDYHVPLFPQSQSSLYAMTIQSQVSVNPTLVIQNSKGSPASASSVALYRSDDVLNNTTGEDVFGATTFSRLWTIPALADQQQAALTAARPVAGYSILYDSLNTTDRSLDNGSYSGTGSQKYTYTATTALNMPNYYSVVAYSDTIRFKVTYFYCSPGVLASDVLSFTAVKQNDGTVLLGWNTTNEKAGRQYKIQVSGDGSNFSDYAAVDSDPVAGDASYTYSYPVDPTISGRLYFRLRIVDESGAMSFSVIRIIDLDRGMQPVKNSFYCYPNPAVDFISLNIPGGTTQPWQVDIIAADGRLVQRNRFNNTNTPRIAFTHKLPAGTYFIRAVSSRPGQRYTRSFVIR